MRSTKETQAILLLGLFLSAAASALYAKPSIIDYYNSIPVRLLGGHRYPLESKNGAWISRSVAEYEIQPVVDVENYYLKIVDPGTGGGSVTQELALYRSNKGRDMIGVNLTESDGLGRACVLKFYEPAADKWTEITDVLLPKADLTLFLNEGHKLNMKKMGKFLEAIEFLYQLPRIGTTITLKIDLDKFIVINRQNREKPASAVMEILKSVKYGEVSLGWNKKNNRFILGEKTLFAPSDLVREYLGLPAAASDKSPDDGMTGAAPENPELLAILEALMEGTGGSSGLDLVFDVQYLKVKNGWAWIHVLPRTRDGQHHFEDLSGLLQKKNGRWILVEMPSGEQGEDSGDSDGGNYFDGLKARFPSVPPEIFPAE